MTSLVTDPNFTVTLPSERAVPLTLKPSVFSVAFITLSSAIFSIDIAIGADDDDGPVNCSLI